MLDISKLKPQRALTSRQKELLKLLKNGHRVDNYYSETEYREVYELWRGNKKISRINGIVVRSLEDKGMLDKRTGKATKQGNLMYIK